MGTVFWKELSDHFSSRRFMILLALILLTGIWATYAAGQTFRQNAEAVPTEFVFLWLLTSRAEGIFSLATFLGFFAPLVGITLGFDAISGEYARGTLSRVLSQPIYRDSLINGKFFAGLMTVGILWVSILLIVIGLGISLLGFPPNGEELWRMLIFTVIGIVYVGFWLALALLFSLLFQRTVTAALASLALWLFSAIFVGMLSSVIASFAAQTSIEPLIRRISPSVLYGETVRILLDPTAHLEGLAMGTLPKEILPTPLALGQSLLLIWPHLTALFALLTICFGIAYIKFMRVEIRA
jgi:ABC-2 type transport system permease protein